MCYDRRRAEACVDESARHALANAGGREIIRLHIHELLPRILLLNLEQLSKKR